SDVHSVSGTLGDVRPLGVVLRVEEGSVATSEISPSALFHLTSPTGIPISLAFQFLHDDRSCPSRRGSVCALFSPSRASCIGESDQSSMTLPKLVLHRPNEHRYDIQRAEFPPSCAQDEYRPAAGPPKIPTCEAAIGPPRARNATVLTRYV